MDNTQRMELICSICEVFEKFLDKRGIILQNADKAEDPNATNLYGMDFAEVYDNVEAILVNAKLISEEAS